MVLEHIWLRKFFRIINGPGPWYVPGAYSPGPGPYVEASMKGVGGGDRTISLACLYHVYAWKSGLWWSKRSSVQLVWPAPNAWKVPNSIPGLQVLFRPILLYPPYLSFFFYRHTRVRVYKSYPTWFFNYSVVPLFSVLRIFYVQTLLFYYITRVTRFLV